MTSRDDRKEKLRQLAEESGKIADALTENDFAVLKNITQTDLSKLSPKMTGEENYKKLISIVGEATGQNVSLADFKNRINSLGSEGKTFCKQVVNLLGTIKCVFR